MHSTEAEVFADIAREKGVPDGAILIENKSQNTGDNYKFALELLKQKAINHKTIIAV
ncbi:MAG: YdcF family protein [Candidatus Paceibacterota bacterium]